MGMSTRIELRLENLESQLRQLIRDSGKSASAVAEMAKITQPNMSSFLAKKRGFTIETLERVADVLGYDVRLVPRGEPAKFASIPLKTRRLLRENLSAVLAALDSLDVDPAERRE